MRLFAEQFIFGSSPRPWGTSSTPFPWTRRRRFIPTPVGNMRRIATPSFRSPVHPHARGEHSPVQSFTVSLNGSSPRPWGTSPINATEHDANRFIPTPVGNIRRAMRKASRNTVHPHARGEHGRGRGGGGSNDGSSPRPWGTCRLQNGAGHPHRFIPTPVGNISLPSRAARRYAVHPHARGEHIFAQPRRA